MNKRIHSLIIGIFLLCIMLGAYIPVQALEEEAARCELAASLQVESQDSQELPKEWYTFVLEPGTDTEDFSSQTVRVQATDQSAIQFAALTFTQPGTYSFRLYQKEGQNENIGYDSIVYDVTITVLHDKNKRLVPTVIVTEEGKEGKLDSLSFVNHYKKMSTQKNNSTDTSSSTYWKAHIFMGLGALGIMFLLRRKRHGS